VNPWIIGAVLLGAALLFRGGMGPRPIGVLTVWREKYLPPNWPQLARAGEFGAVSMKVVDGTGQFQAAEAARVIAQARAAGLKAFGWGWHNLRTTKEALAEAARAATEVNRHNLKAYSVNAEKVWTGTEDQPKTENPAQAMAVFVDEFRRLAPGVELIFNGYSSEYTSDGRPALIPEVLAKFDAFGPMNYGTKRSTISNKYRTRSARARAAGVDFAPMHGTGRVAKNGAVWGFNQGPDGLLQLVREDPPKYLAFWYGPGSEAMLAQGSSANVSLSELMRAAHGAPSAAS
jgi:hypothetical protein